MSLRVTMPGNTSRDLMLGKKIAIESGRVLPQQAIMTRYLCATNTKGARVVAQASGGSRCVSPYHYDVTDYMAHWCAAVALCGRLGWDGAKLIPGTMRDGYVFVFPPG